MSNPPLATFAGQAGAEALVPTTITLYPSDPTQQKLTSRIIGTSTDFIFYALKAGHIRVLYRHGNARTLLRGHTAQVVDIQLCGHADGSAVSLASVGKDGQLIFWQIDIVKPATPGPDTPPELNAKIVAQLAHPEKDMFYTKICYSVAVASAVTIDVAGRLALWLPGGPGGPAGPVSLDTPGAQPAFVSVCFSPAGNMIAAGTDAGAVVTWVSSPSGFVLAGRRTAHAASICSVWVTETAASGGGPGAPVLTTASCDEIKVWSVSGECLQTLATPAAPYDRFTVLASESVVFAACTGSPSLAAFYVDGRSGLITQATESTLGGPVLSITAERQDTSLNVFAVQLQHIQQFTLAVADCVPAAPPATNEAAAAAAAAAALSNQPQQGGGASTASAVPLEVPPLPPPTMPVSASVAAAEAGVGGSASSTQVVARVDAGFAGLQRLLEEQAQANATMQAAVLKVLQDGFMQMDRTIQADTAKVRLPPPTHPPSPAFVGEHARDLGSLSEICCVRLSDHCGHRRFFRPSCRSEQFNQHEGISVRTRVRRLLAPMSWWRGRVNGGRPVVCVSHMFS
eukprot:SAG22_NODE_121_length_19129_cov_36.644614_3_plen_570_part_00